MASAVVGVTIADRVSAILGNVSLISGALVLMGSVGRTLLETRLVLGRSLETAAPSLAIAGVQPNIVAPETVIRVLVKLRLAADCCKVSAREARENLKRSGVQPPNGRGNQ
jgi:hypothetical protein